VLLLFAGTCPVCLQGDHFLLLWDQRVLHHFRSQDPEPYVDPTPTSASASSSSSSSRAAWTVAESASWQDVEALLTCYSGFCLRVGSVVGEAHNLWELFADRERLDSPACEELVGW
jgi:hypothetical protein